MSTQPMSTLEVSDAALLEKSLLEDRHAVLAIALGLTTVIAAADFLVKELSLGILYVIPIIQASLVLPRPGILALSLLAALLQESLDPLSWDHNAPSRIALGVIIFTASGFFVSELMRNRRLTLRHLRQLEVAARLQKDAEDESRHLLEGSPGAILTFGANGRILLANRAANQLLGSGDEPLTGQAVTEFLPMLAAPISSAHVVSMVRTMVEGSARRKSGEWFFVQMWLSSYQTNSGPRLAAIFTDATEVLRDREELGLRQLLMNSRIAAAAVSHEVRNLSNAAYRLFSTLATEPGIASRTDYQTLGSLLDGMRRLTTEELRPNVEEALLGADVNVVLQELFLILDPGLRESGAHLHWEVAPDLPRVRADHSGLLQVILNLAQNGQQALRQSSSKRLSLVAHRMEQYVLIRISNSGESVALPERLFEPLQSGSNGAGLGLFISRAILRTYGGELQYVPQKEGCMFLIQVPVVSSVKETTDA